jgi:pimeloyl-ACP methyl ester carboxylesterase
MRSILAIRNRFALIVAAGCAALLAGPVCGQEAPTARGATDEMPRFEPSPCPALPAVKALATARCGYLVVPEDRRRPAGRTIRLIVAIVPALSSRPAPDPVVYLASGPGGIALGEGDFAVADGLNRDRDLVLMNQRGTYLSVPTLTCASVDDFYRRLLGLRFYAESTRRAHLAATRACREELVATGAELSAYNSSENAADFADLRHVLGYPQWNVFGESYGTYLAQTLMRDHPSGIRSVILDSTISVSEVTIPGVWFNTRAGFDNLFRACAAQAACRSAHPHLEDTFTRLVTELEARPLASTVKDPQTGAATEVVTDGGALVDWLRNRSYKTPEFRSVPDLIDQLAARRPAAIEAIAKERVAEVVPSGLLGYGLAFGVVCREWYPFATGRDRRDAGRRAFPRYPASIQDEAVGGWAYANGDCSQVWDVPPAPSAVRRAPRGTIPTLFISGSFDAVASLDWTKAAARTLPHSTIISIPGVGHYVAPQSPCAQAVIASFLANPNAPEASCVGALLPPVFTSRDLP